MIWEVDSRCLSPAVYIEGQSESAALLQGIATEDPDDKVFTTAQVVLAAKAGNTLTLDQLNGNSTNATITQDGPTVTIGTVSKDELSTNFGKLRSERASDGSMQPGNRTVTVQVTDSGSTGQVANDRSNGIEKRRSAAAAKSFPHAIHVSVRVAEPSLGAARRPTLLS